MKCDECNNANICLDHIEMPSLGGCTGGIPDHKVTTNADRIRSMSNKELAKAMEHFITCETCNDILHQKYCDLRYGDCFTKLLKWLQSPVDEKVIDDLIKGD